MVFSLPNPCHHSNILFFSNLASQLTKAQPIPFNHHSFLSFKRGRTNSAIEKTGMKPETKEKEERKSQQQNWNFVSILFSVFELETWMQSQYISNINKYNCIDLPFMNLAWWRCREMKLQYKEEHNG